LLKTPSETSPRKVLSESQPDASSGDWRIKFAALAAADDEFVYEPSRPTGKEDRKGPLRVGVEKSSVLIELCKPKQHLQPMKKQSVRQHQLNMESITSLIKKVVQHGSVFPLHKKENELLYSSPIRFEYFVRNNSRLHGPTSEISPIRHLETSQHSAGLAKNQGRLCKFPTNFSYATEDELLNTARHMAETAIPIKKTVKKLPFQHGLLSIYAEEDEEESQEPTLEQEHPEDGPNQDGEVIEEGDFDDSYFQHETNETVDGIQAIDAAFEFINSPQKHSHVSLRQDYHGTPNSSNQFGPLATHEMSPYTPPFTSTNLQPLNSDTTTLQTAILLWLIQSLFIGNNARQRMTKSKNCFAGVQTPTSQQKVIQAESHHDREKRVDTTARIRQAIAVEGERGLRDHFGDIDVVYYFVILIKCETTLLHTALNSNENKINDDGSIELKKYFQIENIHPDFNCIFEVYALRSKRRHVRHWQSRSSSSRIPFTLSEDARISFLTRYWCVLEKG
ncbi:unnamed protein product, partial [Mesorhabditis belari]